MMIFTADSPDKLLDFSDTVLQSIDEGYHVVLLEGALGSGKTTFVKALCQEMGVMDPVSSPTFSIIQEYMSPGHGIIYHMDFYRLEQEKDLEQIGLYEYLDSGNICLIEWPDLAKAYFTMPHLSISITTEQDNIRNFRITKHDAVDA